MKRGKDEEKVAGPMFPRLHVNDTEKGGPRAPPRNKMALYEQFSIPSHRFDPRLLPLDTSNSCDKVPPASSGQGAGPERSYIFPSHLPSRMPPHRAESYISRQSDGESPNTSLAQLEQTKKVDEDDFRVPVYVQSRIGQSNDKTLESCDGRNLTPMGSRNFGCSIAVQNDGGRDLNRFGSTLVKGREDVRSVTEGLPQVSPRREPPVKNISTGETMDSLARQACQAKVIANQEYQDCPLSNLRRLCDAEACLQQEYVTGSLSNDIEHGDGPVESTRNTDTGNTLVPIGCFHSTANQTSPVEASYDADYHDIRTGSSLQKGNLDESDDISKISTIENLSSLKATPDDVVGVLGQKRFWKARQEIVNQQRVFAVQLFELHRLIKVQQLIAGSPDLLLEDSAFMGKFPLKGSSPKTISLEVVVKPQQQNLKRKNDSEKLNHKMECSAENAVGKTSLSSPKNGSHLSNYTPLTGNLHQANVVADNRMGPCFFNQSPGHQWLVPVMSPSEGLVYKPYAGAGFTGTMSGGCGPFGPFPLGGTFMNPAYGIPVSHQVIGVPPNIPPGNHGYLPPYGMPVMNQVVSGSAVEQGNQFGAQGSHGQDVDSSVEGTNFNTQNQSSCNLAVQRNGAISQVKKFQASKESELQGSTASSPNEMTKGIRTGQTAEGRDAHSHSHVAPLVPEGVLQSLEIRQQTRVIKVVPRNPRSATESAARIFQSIQEERKQYDSV